MESETFRSRVVRLLQKSRQAYRLYSSMGRMPRGLDSAQYTEMQAAEWRGVNAELIKGLSAALEKPSSKELAGQVLLLRENFQRTFRETEAALNSQQRELVVAAEKGDFVKGAVLGRSLISVKARVQALQAAQHELQSLCAQSHSQQPDIMLSPQQAVNESVSPRIAQVIPLRRR